MCDSVHERKQKELKTVIAYNAKIPRTNICGSCRRVLFEEIIDLSKQICTSSYLNQNLSKDFFEKVNISIDKIHKAYIALGTKYNSSKNTFDSNTLLIVLVEIIDVIFGVNNIDYTKSVNIPVQEFCMRTFRLFDDCLICYYGALAYLNV